MSTVFLNGTNFTGFQFTTAIQLIDQMETTLVSAGWIIISKVSGISLFVKGITEINNHNCWVEFIISGTSPSLTLTMRGWLEEEKINGSPNSIHTATFNDGGINRLWLTADNEAGCFCLYNSNGSCVGYHFGFLQRVDTGDRWAWMLGRLNATGYQQAYSAKSGFNNTLWRQLSADYTDSTNFNTGVQVLPLSTFDFLSRGKPGDGVGGGGTTFLSSYGNSNAFLSSFNGRLNYNQSAVIDPYGYCEGRGNTANYPSSSSQLYFRGFVKFAYCGVASLLAGISVTDLISGNRILSVGGSSWQGMRIL
jgi:hypothetical protein